MTGLDIVILAVGGILVVISFFLVDRKDKELLQLTPEEKSKKIEELMNEFKPRTKQAIEELSSACVEDTKGELERITNEKILAVNEFGEQLLEKIKNSHDEVVFLYGMMMKKDEEMKSTLNRMEVLRKENQAFSEKIIELRNAKVKAMGGKIEPEKEQNKTDASPVSIAPKPTPKPIATTKKLNLNTAKTKQEDDEEELPERIKKQILELHEKNFSIREISRKLSVGQGEVKLIIDLYS